MDESDEQPRKEIRDVREDSLPIDNVNSVLLPIKKKRGRPRKICNNPPQESKTIERCIAKKRGRPKKMTPGTVEDCDGIYREVCCALGCSNTSKSFLMCPLPKNPEVRQQWIENIGLRGYDISEYCKLCEIHFEPCMWKFRINGHIQMKSNAVPTRFLRGENIKSWVTMDQTGVVKGKQINGEIKDNDQNCARTSSKILFEPVHSEETESILPDVFVPSIKEEYSDELGCLESVVTHNIRNSLDNLFKNPVTKICENKNVKETVGFFRDKTKNKRYKCPLCKKILTQRGSFKYHLMNIHPNSEFTKTVLAEMEKTKYCRKRKVLDDFLFHPTISSVSISLPSTHKSKYIFSVPAISTHVTPALSSVIPTPMSVNHSIKPPIPTPLSVTHSIKPPILAAVLKNNSLNMSGRGVKQFLLLVPQPAKANSTQLSPLNIPTPIRILPPPLLRLTGVRNNVVQQSSKINMSQFDSSEAFHITLPPLPLDKLVALKMKLMELVESVTIRGLDPQNIIMLYGTTMSKPLRIFKDL